MKEQMDTDIQTAEQAIEDAKAGVLKLQKELEKLANDVAICEVLYF
jgi:peptidoglycan hydrolase CwlO-like protein